MGAEGRQMAVQQLKSSVGVRLSGFAGHMGVPYPVEEFEAVDCPVLKRLYNEGIVETASGETIDNAFDSAVSLFDGMTLHNFIRETRPQRTLEIGLAYGASALFMCAAQRANGNETFQHTALDPFQTRDFHAAGKANLERSGFGPNFEFHEQTSLLTLPAFIKEARLFDFAFIDGNHIFDDVIVDFLLVNRLLPVGGLLAFHDTDYPAIRKVIAFALRNMEYELAPEFDRYRPQKTLRVRNFLRNIKRNPLEPYIWRYGSLKAPCVVTFLRKTGESERHWTHYRPF